MTAAGKVVFNTIVLGILTAIMCGLYMALDSFVLPSACKVVQYVLGSARLESGL